MSTQDTVVRGKTVSFSVNGSDDRNDFYSLDVEWAQIPPKNQGCGGIGKADWPSVDQVTSLANSVWYSFLVATDQKVCVCAMVTDGDGARGLDCELVAPINVDPVAQIDDVSGALSGQTRPLCSLIHLSAEKSEYPEDDEIVFNWGLEYSGTDSVDISTQLGACEGVPADKTEMHRCFYAGATGTFTIKLSITDRPPGAGSQPLTSKPVEFKIPVDVDRPPCLQRTDPEVYRQRIMLSTSKDMGVTYDSRTFKVLSVADDCEPYPVPDSGKKRQTKFVWWVYDENQTPPGWGVSAYTTNSFEVSQRAYLNALPGDSIKVRVEVRDEAVQKSLSTGGASACPLSEDICCGPDGCKGDDNDCIRWTTWTVVFF